MKKLAILVLAFACRAAPPESISVDPSLPDGVHVAVARARDAWCAAPVGWCPELLEEGGEAIVISGHWDTEINLNTEEPGGGANNDRGSKITISANLLSAGFVDADYWTGAVTHEFGHFGINDHVSSSALMKRLHETPESIPWDVDPAAAREWCEQQGC